MSLLNKLKAREVGTGRGNLPPMLNVAVQVLGFEGDRIRGVRLDTNEEVTAHLRDLSDDDRARLKKERPAVEKFVCDKGYYEKRLSVCESEEERKETLKGISNKTEPGGVVMFEGVYVDKNKELSARWATCISRWTNANMVLPKAMVRINPTFVREGENGKQTSYNVSATILDIDAAIKVKDGAALRGALVEAFGAQGIANGAGVMVRYMEGDQVIPMEQMLGSKAIEGKKNAAGFDEREFYTPEEAADHFLKSENGQMLASWDGEGAVVEVVPTLTVRMGSAAKEQMLGKDTKWTDKQGVDHVVTGDERLRNFGKRFALANGSRGFTECVVSFQEPKGTASPIFTVIEPYSFKPTFVPAVGVATANIAMSQNAVDSLARMEDGAVDQPASAQGEFGGVDLNEFNDAPSAAKRSGPGL